MADYASLIFSIRVEIVTCQRKYKSKIEEILTQQNRLTLRQEQAT